MRVASTSLDIWNDWVYVSECPGSFTEVWVSGLDDFREHLELIDTIEYTKFIMIQKVLQRKKARRIGSNGVPV